jgi:hypothetical protein
MFEVTSTWKTTYPEALAGVLVVRAVSNHPHHPALESKKSALEQDLRAQFSGQDRAAIASHPVLQAYAEYYRQFKKTYHIQLQWSPIVWQIIGVAALVESMFMAEMQIIVNGGMTWMRLGCPHSDVATGPRLYSCAENWQRQRHMIRDQAA